MDILSTFATMLGIVSPIFVVIGLGMAIRRAGILGEGFIADAHRLFYYVGLPVIIFQTIATTAFDEAFHMLQVGASALAFVLLLVVCHLLGGWWGLTPPRRGAFSQAAIRGNMNYIGLPVIYAAAGSAGLAAGGVYLGFMVALLNVLCVFALIWPHRGCSCKVDAEGDPVIVDLTPGAQDARWPDSTQTTGEPVAPVCPRTMCSRQTSFSRQMVRQVVQNPMVLAALAGIAWSMAALPMPPVLDDSLSLVGRLALPLALLVIGAEFRLAHFRFGSPLLWAVSVVKLLVVPAVVGLVLWAVGVRGLPLTSAVLFAACPVSTASFVLAGQLGGSRSFSRDAILHSTLLAVLTFAVVLTALAAVPQISGLD